MWRGDSLQSSPPALYQLLYRNTLKKLICEFTSILHNNNIHLLIELINHMNKSHLVTELLNSKYYLMLILRILLCHTYFFYQKSKLRKIILHVAIQKD